MSFRIPPLLVFPALALLAAATIGAETESSGSFSEYLEVQLVNVELFATDKRGEPVGDLTLEEIRVFEDGQPVEVTHFLPPAGATDERALAAELGREATPVRIALFVDNLNTGPASRARVLAQLWEVLESDLRPRDEVMVASFDGSLQIEMGFTRNRKELRRALDHVTALSGDRLTADLRDRNALEAIQWETETSADGPCLYVGQLARQHADEANYDVQRTLSALEDFIGSLAGVPGRKVLMHVSDGIPLIPGAEAWNHAIALCDGSGGIEGVPGATVADQLDGTPNRFDPKTAVFDMQSYDTTDQWRRLAAQASAQRVVFYPLYAPGLTAPWRSRVDAVRSTVRNEMSYVLNKQDTLSILADETGGQAQFSTNDFRPAVRAAIDESLASHELAYVSPAEGDGGLHSIRVEVDRPGVRLRYRKSYQAKSVLQRVEDGVRSALFYGLEQNPLEARVQAARAGEGIVDGKARVQVRISLPLDRLTLMPKEGHHSGLFTVFVAAREASGGTSPIGHRTIPVQVPDEKLAATGEDFLYVVEMEVGLEPTTIAVALRDELGGATSYVTTVAQPAG